MFTEYQDFTGHVAECLCRTKNPQMDLSFNNCFNDDERDLESLSENDSADSRIYCPHCREKVHRSTFYRHKTKYLEEPSESIFNGEFNDGEFANCHRKPEPLESLAVSGADLEMFDAEFDESGRECRQNSEFLDENNDVCAHYHDQDVNEAGTQCDVCS